MADGSGLPGLMDLPTPQELEQNRAVARALIAQGMGPIQGESGTVAVSPFQVLGGLTQEAVGLHKLKQAAQQERGEQASLGVSEAGTGPAGAGMLGTQPPGSQPAAYGGGIEPLLHAVSHNEGTGGYNQLGQLVKTSYGLDRAYGKYQVMGANIPQWTKDILGYSMTPEQFLQDPNAQEAVARTKLAEYAQKYGPEGAAKAWFAGEKGMNNPNATAHRPDGTPLGPTVAQYGATAAAQMGGGGTPQPQVQNASAVGPLAYKPPAPGGVPAPNAGVPSQGIPNASVFPYRPGMTTEQFQMIMANPKASEVDKAEARARYLGQFQPVEMGLPFNGRAIMPLIGPNAGQPFQVPGTTTIKKEISSPGGGGIKTETPTLYNYPGIPGAGAPEMQQLTPQKLPAGPQSNASPVGEPPAGGGAQPITAQGPGAQGKSPLDAVSPDLLPEIKSSGSGTPGKSSAAEKPIKTAMAGDSDVPLTGSGPASGPSPGGPLSAPPPTQASMQTAQGGPTPDISSDDAQTMHYLQDQGVQYQGRLEGMKSATEFYKGVRDQGLAAAQNRDLYNEAARIVNSPDFYSGIGSGLVQAWKRGVAALGGDPNSAAAMESFNKIRNDLNLGALRSKLGGLGQIRLAEVNMVDNAFANLNNSVAANKALITIAQRVNDRIAEAAQLANQYVNEHQGVADPSLANRLQNYYWNKPLMTDDEIKQFMAQIETKKTQTQGGPLSAPPPGNGPPAGYKKVQ